jgi:hypothetical protein
VTVEYNVLSLEHFALEVPILHKIKIVTNRIQGIKYRKWKNKNEMTRCTL